LYLVDRCDSLGLHGLGLPWFLWDELRGLLDHWRDLLEIFLARGCGPFGLRLGWHLLGQQRWRLFLGHEWNSRWLLRLCRWLVLDARNSRWLLRLCRWLVLDARDSRGLLRLCLWLVLDKRYSRGLLRLCLWLCIDKRNSRGLLRLWLELNLLQGNGKGRLLHNRHRLGLLNGLLLVDHFLFLLVDHCLLLLVDHCLLLLDDHFLFLLVDHCLLLLVDHCLLLLVDHCLLLLVDHFLLLLVDHCLLLLDDDLDLLLLLLGDRLRFGWVIGCKGVLLGMAVILHLLVVNEPVGRRKHLDKLVLLGVLHKQVVDGSVGHNG